MFERYTPSAPKAATKLRGQERTALRAFAWSELAKALDKQGRRGEAELATAERSYHVGDYASAQGFSRRAMRNLDPGTPLHRRAEDIAAVTDPRLAENRRYYRRR